MKLALGKSGRVKGLKRVLSGLTAKHIHQAIKQYTDQNGEVDTYDESTKYDLVVDGVAYPPKAILGLAASSLLGQAFPSSYFAGGERSTCFEILQSLGFAIAVKNDIQGTSHHLKLYDEYSRGDVAKVIEPDVDFKAGSGKWGVSGIISMTPNEGDFTFFVTLGQHDANDYDDALTEDGFLIWKSQNRHTQNSPIIQSLISHDHELNNIRLFLRASEDDDYTFMGPLEFHSWDINSSAPVHFTWKLMSWPLPANIYSRFAEHIRPAIVPTYSPSELATGQQLELTPAPTPKSKKTKGKVRTVNPDWARKEQTQRELGNAGEFAVMAFEKERLIAAGCSDLADQIEHVALVDSSAGYDIQSSNEDGSTRLIEVKTTTGSIDTPFFISSNELAVSSKHIGSYWIYRLYEFDTSTGKGLFYIVTGDLESSLLLEPSVFKAMPR